jgi:calcineurin-like phosphoesterase family protein
MMTGEYDLGLLARKYGDVWFTGNWRLGQDVQRDAQLIDRHNACVEARDMVWMLGNLFAPGVTPDLGRVPGIQGRKILMAGETDTCFSAHTADPKKLAALTDDYQRAGFHAVVNGAAMARKGWAMRLPLGPGRAVFWLSPFQFATGPNEPFAAWRPKRPVKGSAPWLLCGEGDSSWHARDRMINVSVDAWQTPVPLELIHDQMMEVGSDDHE